MGFHLCDYCKANPGHKANKYANSSSGDVTLIFNDGVAYTMPDMILHYIADHKFLPESTFIAHVMKEPLVGGGRMQTRSANVVPVSIGYLSGEFPTGRAPIGFLRKLEQYMYKAEKMMGGYRALTKGVTR